MLLKRVLSLKQPMPFRRIRIWKTPNSKPESPQESLEPSPKKPCNTYPNPFGLEIFGHGILAENAMELVDTSAFANDEDLPAIPPPS
jgi:hypothetical protein